MQEPVSIRADETTGTKIKLPVVDPPAARLVSAVPSVSKAISDSGATARSRWSSAFQRHEWTRSLAIFTTCSVLLLWGFRSEVGAAIDVWTVSRSFGHAFLVFPTTLCLFYLLRHRLAALQPKTAPWALILVAGAMLLWMIGDLANLMVVKQLAFVAAWQSMFLLAFGWQVSKLSIFPLLYLYLAVPFGLSLIPTLQNMTAQIVVYLLRFSGVPVFLDGYYIEIPSASFLVAESCSGVRYLMVCIALGLLTAHLFFHSWPRRILFVALAMVVPIVANGIRAYSIVMIAYNGPREFAVHFDHVIYGFAFLSVVTLSLLGLGALLRVGDFSSLRGAANPVVSDRTSGGFETVTLGRFGQVLCAVLAVGIVISVQIWTEAAKAPPPSLGVALHAPVAGYPWAPDGEAPAWTPRFHGTDSKLQQSYSRGKERVDLYVGYYAYQREGAEAVSDLNTISSGSEVKVLSSKRTKVRIADVSLPINELAILHHGQSFLLWYWYWIGGENTNSRFAAKLLEMKALATGSERAGAIVAVSAEVSENVKEAANLLNSFLQESLGSKGAPFELETSSPRAVVSEPQSSPDQAGRAVNP